MSRFASYVLVFAGIINIFAAAVSGVGEISTPTPELTPTAKPVMPPMSDRLEPPPTVYPPTQADQGAQVYYLVCMACHGDKGQGLTDEWRDVLNPGDRNCWQSHCHASNHPLEGFKLPEYIPAVVSPGLLDGFGNALNLYNYIKARMPWQAPGSLTDEEYWQLTAYLIRANGISVGDTWLDPHSAESVALLLVPTATPQPTAAVLPLSDSINVNLGLTGGVILLFVSLTFILVWVRSGRKS